MEFYKKCAFYGVIALFIGGGNWWSRYGVSVFMNQRIYTFLMTAGSAAGSLSSMMLQHCTPEEQRYAEEILKTFIMAMNSKHE